MNPAEAALVAAVRVWHADGAAWMLERYPGGPRLMAALGAPGASLRALWVSEQMRGIEALPPAWRPDDGPCVAGAVRVLRRVGRAWWSLRELRTSALMRAWAQIRPGRQRAATRVLGAWVWAQAARTLSQRRLLRALAALGDDARKVIDLASCPGVPVVGLRVRLRWAESIGMTAERVAHDRGLLRTGQRLLHASVERLGEVSRRYWARTVLGLAAVDAKTAAPLPLDEADFGCWSRRLAQVLVAAGEVNIRIEDGSGEAAGGRTDASSAAGTCDVRAIVSGGAAAAGGDRGNRGPP